jgi:undecaprenyl-diphosphatase
MSSWKAFILAIIEGLTEFLPVSSTGHLIIGSHLLGVDSSDAFVKLFIIAVQPGAIFAVLVLYWKRFLQDFSFYTILLVAFLPAAFFGLLLGKHIDALLESPMTVAISLVIGGIIFLFVDKGFTANETYENQKITPKKALTIGLFQVLSMIPGTSRSGATILGGLFAKLNRKNSAEFSFFLAVPTIMAATGYKLVKELFKKDGNSDLLLHSEHISILVWGNVVAFVVGLLAIKGFIGYLTKHGLSLFGWYRIIVGSIIIVMLSLGYELNVLD